MAKSDQTTAKVINQHGAMGFAMFTAFVGAFVYFLQSAHHFGDVLFALLKALVWPGFVLYHGLQLLGA